MPEGRPVAIVTPRFGAGVIGGAEAVAQEVAMALVERGWPIEVLTTCAVDHFTWENARAEGITVERGVTVRRFRNVFHDSSVGRRAQQRIQASEIPPIDEQLTWLSYRFTVPGLFDHLLRHGRDYRAVLFTPYMFWTSTVCLPLVADRAVAIPCLHDETYARLDVVRPVFEDPAAVWFYSDPEFELAQRLFDLPPERRVIGAGVDVPAGYDPAGFRRRAGLKRPFALYAARREPEKGWNWVLDLYRQIVADDPSFPVDLVSLGAGTIDVPQDLAGRVHDLGAVSDVDRDDAMAASLAYLQPSLMESFSRSTMEAWLASTPVLGGRGEQVVSWHIRRSGGGGMFNDASALAHHLRRYEQHPEVRAEEAEAGRRYVLENYTWPVAIDRIEAGLNALETAGVGAPS